MDVLLGTIHRYSMFIEINISIYMWNPWLASRQKGFPLSILLTLLQPYTVGEFKLQINFSLVISFAQNIWFYHIKILIANKYSYFLCRYYIR